MGSGRRFWICNIVNDKLTISVFSLLEKNLHNVKEINFEIRDVKFLPHQTEIAHEFEINPNELLAPRIENQNNQFTKATEHLSAWQTGKIFENFLKKFIFIF